MHIFFSVGEPSGDQHAAHLIHALRRRRPDVRFSGFGGPLMEQAGCTLLFQLTNLAVMGFVRVVPLLWRFYKLLRQGDRYLREQRPDAVVLVDFPGFNWWIARKAKAAGIPVFYYLPPQLWAWAPWRIRKMRKFVDHVLCGLSFEPKWYADRGMHVEFVGHPFFDEVAEYPLDRAFCETQRQAGGPIVGVLPGSRNHEVSSHWGVELEIMRRVRARHPDVRFLVANYKEPHRDRCRAELETWLKANPQEAPLPVEFHVGRTPEIVELSDCCLMVSGSVSQEMLARRTPAAVIYACGPLLYVLKLLFAGVTSMTLPNLMANRVLLPEKLIAVRREPAVTMMTDAIDRWLSGDGSREALVRELDRLAKNVGKTGASGRAADVILAKLTDRTAASRAA